MFKGIIVKIKNIIIGLVGLFIGMTNVFAEEASLHYQIYIPEHLHIETITSPILVANITDDTGNLYTSLTSRFKIVSNSEEEKNLYLKANSTTENGLEPAMFQVGGRTYIAFTNVSKPPKSEALMNCKANTHPKLSPGVVAYPITSITGAKTKYQRGNGNYEVTIKNGVTNLSVNVGSQVLRNSFDSNDPKGFYQATLSLTEADI